MSPGNGLAVANDSEEPDRTNRRARARAGASLGVDGGTCGSDGLADISKLVLREVTRRARQRVHELN